MEDAIGNWLKEGEVRHLARYQVISRSLVDKLPVKLAVVEDKAFPTLYAMCRPRHCWTR